MTNYRVRLPECMSYENNFEISEILWANLSHKTYDGVGYVSLVRHAVEIVGSCERHEIFEDYMTCALLAYTLQGHPMHWCATLHEKFIHSLSHLVAEIDCDFNHFDHKALNKEILEL